MLLNYISIRIRLHQKLIKKNLIIRKTVKYKILMLDLYTTYGSVGHNMHQMPER